MELTVERTIDKPYRHVRAALCQGPAAWLPGLQRCDGEVTTELTVPVATSHITRTIVVVTGPVVPHPDGCTVPVSWRAARHPALYPALSGTLEVAPLAARCTRLSLHASYDPPAGMLGELFDHVFLHRLAESSVRQFMDRVAGVLAREAMSEALTPARPVVASEGGWPPEPPPDVDSDD